MQLLWHISTHCFLHAKGLFAFLGGYSLFRAGIPFLSLPPPWDFFGTTLYFPLLWTFKKTNNTKACLPPSPLSLSLTQIGSFFPPAPSSPTHQRPQDSLPKPA